MRTTLGARLQKAEQSVKLVLTVREWEALTDPVTVARQFQEAKERMPLCTSAEEVMALLGSLPIFDEDIFARCGSELIALILYELLQRCTELQEQSLRRFQIVDKARRALREGNLR
jgi:hypothetical protein